MPIASRARSTADAFSHRHRYARFVELRVLFGRNGIGKSTLLKIAAGLIAADSGVVHFNGQSYARPRFAELARCGVFFLPDHDLLSNAFTVRYQLEMFRERFDGRVVVENARRVGIETQLDKRPYQLSGGELRRAELAAVFVRRPLCLLADEPYRGVAPHDAEDLTIAFRELAAEGTAVVVTGHEVPTLLDAADHVTWCTAGTTYELGPPGVACHHDAFGRDYLGRWALGVTTATLSLPATVGDRISDRLEREKK
ncbi:MAG TPA: ATP-binding cassette domain-containing protein [Gemmatimonadaceae bacterium]